jgi:2-polyprenyl-6-methoxyphenol hydroxylase-like FAD-dependent oxidoreductase
MGQKPDSARSRSREKAMTTPHVLITGAGPAGAALAYLLARRGVAVTLLEKHPDFTRAFRGEGLQPSGIEAFAQMGLSDQLARLPQASVDTLELYQGRRLRATLTGDKIGFVGRFVSQPAMLAMLTEEAKRHPSFRLEMGVTVRELLYEEGRVAGVRATGPNGSCEIRADLVIGTDGRNSITRKQGGFHELQKKPGFDVLWVKVPRPPFWTNPRTVRLEMNGGHFTGALPASDGLLQVGFTIPKGSFPHLRAKGVEAWTEELLGPLSADLAAHLRGNREAMSKAVLLDVIVGRLTEWTRPGLLLLGDAAHPMSPVGGQGINLALRDTLVAANHLVPALLGGGGAAAIDAAARRVAAERMPEIIEIQEHQDRQAKMFTEPHWLRRQMMRVLPLLANTGLLKLMLGRRLRALKHGATRVRLAA